MIPASMSDADVSPTEVDGHQGYTLSAAGGAWMATFLPSLGMVGSSLRHRGVELLAQRGGVAAYAERGSTFGIPLLHPWANRLGGWSYEAAGRRVTLDPHSPRVRRDGDTGLPIHGLLAASPYWTVREARATGDQALLSADLDFGAHEDLLATFPFPHRLELAVRLGDAGLAVDLRLTAAGDAAVPLCFGFHPYLQLPAQRDACSIKLGVHRRLVLDDRGLPTGRYETFASGALGGTLEARCFDDCFDELRGAQPRFSLSGGGRETEVTFLAGFAAAQVYSPADAEFICFEPMAAPVNALGSGQGLRIAPPGSSFRAGFSVSSRAR